MFLYRSLVAVVVALLLGGPSCWGAEPKTIEVAGEVVDEEGRLVANVQVAEIALGAPESSATTNEQGRFAFEIPFELRGTRVFVAKDRSGVRQAYARYLTETMPTPLRLSLRPARELTVDVVDSAGHGIPGAVVAATTSTDSLAHLKTNDAGQAVLRVPASAVLNAVIASKDGLGLDYITFRPSNQFTPDPYRLASDHRQPIKLVLGPVRTVQVRLVDARESPLAGIEVELQSIALQKKGGPVSISKAPGLAASTDEHGIATFRTIPQSARWVSFGVISNTHVQMDQLIFDPTLATEPKTLKLLRRVPIAGQVVDAQDEPVAEAVILVVGAGYDQSQFRGRTQTDDAGRFSIEVKPQQYVAVWAIKENLISNSQPFVVREAPPGREFQVVLKPGTRVFGQVTAGETRKPRSQARISYSQTVFPEHASLPEDQRLPGKPEKARPISLGLSRTTQTNMQGEFEFWAPPGKYSLSGDAVDRHPGFTINDERELRVDSHSGVSPPELAAIEGTVIHADSRKPAENIKVLGWSLSRAGHVRAVTDHDGRFRGHRGVSEMLVHAQSVDSDMAGIVKLGPKEVAAVIPIAPTASARGRLVSSTDSTANRHILWGVRVVYSEESGSHNIVFGGYALTDAKGNFEISGLVPGWKYDLQIMDEREEINHSFMELKTFTPGDAKIAVDLGDVAMPSFGRPRRAQPR